MLLKRFHVLIILLTLSIITFAAIQPTKDCNPTTYTTLLDTSGTWTIDTRGFYVYYPSATNLDFKECLFTPRTSASVPTDVLHAYEATLRAVSPIQDLSPDAKVDDVEAIQGRQPGRGEVCAGPLGKCDGEELSCRFGHAECVLGGAKGACWEIWKCQVN